MLKARVHFFSKKKFFFLAEKKCLPKVAKYLKEALVAFTG